MAGLLRGAARTAVIAGTATSVSAASEMSVRLTQLQQLGELKAQGLLSEAEFEVQKRVILGS